MSAAEVIAKVLAPFLKSAKRRDEAVEALEHALTEAGLLADEFETARVCDSRPGVERVYVGGLAIVLDAAGNAVEVSSPYGLEIAG